MSILSTLNKQRVLIARMTRHEFNARYRTSLLGLSWALISPVLTIGLYAFVFGNIFQARWNQEGIGDNQFSFAMLLFSGFLLFNLLAEVVSRAPGLIVSNQVYVKKILFPLDVLPLVALAGALLNALIATGIFFVIYFILHGPPPALSLLLPLAFAPVVFSAMAAIYLLSSLGVFLRDINQLVPLVVTAMLFLSPIFFPVTALPEEFRFLVYLNPLTLPVNFLRDILFWNRWPDMVSWGVFTTGTLLAAMVAHWWFMRTRKAFADVL